jgi:hypothetical protein
MTLAQVCIECVVQKSGFEEVCRLEIGSLLSRNISTNTLTGAISGSHHCWGL